MPFGGKVHCARTVMSALPVIDKQALFCALFSDRGGHFFCVTPIAGEPVDKQRLTQVGPCHERELLQMICVPIHHKRGTLGTKFLG